MGEVEETWQAGKCWTEVSSSLTVVVWKPAWNAGVDCRPGIGYLGLLLRACGIREPTSHCIIDVRSMYCRNTMGAKGMVAVSPTLSLLPSVRQESRW